MDDHQRIIDARDLARDRATGDLGRALEDVLGEHTHPGSEPTPAVRRLADVIHAVPAGHRYVPDVDAREHTDEQVRRAARALAGLAHKADSYDRWPHVREYYNNKARAVLDALRSEQ